MVEGAHRLLHGRVAVRAVGVDEVDILKLQPLERLVHALDDMLARQAAVVDLGLAEGITPVELQVC